MILALVAAAMLSAADGAVMPPSQAASPAPKITAPDWVSKPSAEDLQTVWPPSSRVRGVGGKVTLGCAVNVRGLLEDCRVLSEEPAGGGFGASALLLTPKFTMRPATKDGVAVRSYVSIPIRFGAMPTTPMGVERVTSLIHPTWLTAPTFADVAAAYPKAGARRDGRVLLRCGVEKDGRVDYCTVLWQEPITGEFDFAALRLVKRFRVAMTPELARIFRLQVQLTVRLPNPDGDEFKARRVLTPTWVTGPDQAFLAGLPAPASGQSTLRCRVAAGGSLTACEALSSDSDSFGEAAALAANALKINLWTDEGDPVDGATLDFKIPPDTVGTLPPQRPAPKPMPRKAPKEATP